MPDASRLTPVRSRSAATERTPGQQRVKPSRLARGLKALSYIASPFRLDAVERAELGARGADEMALQLARIGRALDDALAQDGDPERREALSLGRSLIGEIGERYHLAAGLGGTGYLEGDV